MDEFWRWLFGSGGIVITIWLAKKFFEKNIEEAIKDAKSTAKEAKEAVYEAKNSFNGAIFQVVNSQRDLSNEISKETSKLNTLFIEATRHTSDAMMKSYKTEQEVQALKQRTEEHIVKLARGFQKLNDKIENTKSDVKQISDDLILIKNKKDKP